MENNSGLTDRQRFWLEHLRACGSGSLKAYAAAHGLDVRALYDAKAGLKRKGALSSGGPRLVRARQAQTRSALGGYCRVHLPNGTAIDIACEPGQWAELLGTVAALP